VPLIRSVTPQSAARNALINAKIDGVNFSGSPTVSLSGTGVTATIGIGATSRSLPVILSVTPDANASSRALTVTTAAGTASTTLQIVVPISIAGIVPSAASPGKTFDMAIAGNGVGTATAVEFSGTGVSATLHSYNPSDDYLYITVIVSPGAAMGIRTVTLITKLTPNLQPVYGAVLIDLRPSETPDFKLFNAELLQSLSLLNLEPQHRRIGS